MLKLLKQVDKMNNIVNSVSNNSDVDFSEVYNVFNNLPDELIIYIHSFLNIKQSSILSLVDKKFYNLTQDPYLSQFNWILRSEVIRKNEEKKQDPDILYNKEGIPFIPATSYETVMKEYIKHNHSKELQEMIKDPHASNEDIIEKLNVAADQGSR